MTTFSTAATTLRPSDVQAVAARLRTAIAPLRAALDVAAGAQLRAAAGVSGAAAPALRAHAQRMCGAVTDHLGSLATLAAALETATAELVAQDAGMVRTGGSRS